LQLFLDSLIFWLLLVHFSFEKSKETENRESRNSCKVKVSGVGVEGMMTLRKDWSTYVRLKDWITCMALPVLPPDLEVLLPATIHCDPF